MLETILPILGAFIAGAGGTALVNWARFRNLDRANAVAQIANAQATIHTSDVNALNVSTSLLAVWIKNASEAEEKIITQREEKRLLQDQVDDLLEWKARCTCGAI